MANENKQTSIISVRMPIDVKTMLIDCAERFAVPKNFIVIQALREFLESKKRNKI